MIPLFFCGGGSASILSLDDPSADTDQGNAFTAMVLPVAHTPQPPEGESKLRRAVQTLGITTSATVKVTPIADGNENPDDAQTFNLSSTTDGANPTIESHTANQGGRFQVKVEVTAHVGQCELAESEAWTVAKLSSRMN